jgi:hypothetical protein
MKSVPPGRAVRARCCVLGRGNSLGYCRSLRPCIAPAQPAQIDERHSGSSSKNSLHRPGSVGMIAGTRGGHVPHNFVKINAMSPNPGLRTRENVEPIIEKHHGKFENLWFDGAKSPTYAYVLVKDGDLDGILHDLHGLEVIRLFEAP